MSSKMKVNMDESIVSLNKLLEEWENKKLNLDEFISKKIVEITNDEGTQLSEEEKKQLKKELFKKYNDIITAEINELNTTKAQLELCI